MLVRVLPWIALAQFVEAERGITLLQYAAADYTPCFRFQLILMMVFDDEQSIFGQQIRRLRAEHIKNRRIVRCVGGIEEDDVPGLPGVRLLRDKAPQVVESFRLNDRTLTSFNPAKLEI